MFMGAFGSQFAIEGTIMKATPLILCGLGVSAAFRMQLWNIGAEGQLYMGAMAATWVALNYGNNNSPVVVLSLMFIAGAIAGGIWGLIPGIMKALQGANEVITTLMMNYIAIFFISYLVYGPWKDPTGYSVPMTAQFSKNAWLPRLGHTSIHAGIIIAIVLAAIMWIVFYKTRWGYEIRVSGSNEKAARYSGMNIAKNIMLVMFLSGALAGIAGMSEAAGIQHRLQNGISSGYGYTAIIVAWLARLHPAAIVLSAILFGGLLVGGDQLQIAMRIPVSVSNILQGLILFFVLGGEILFSYKIKFSNKGGASSPLPAKENV
jgi:simple sugar transport system permease protein